MTLSDPVPQEARTELERLARRWQQLPLDRALAHVPAVRALTQRYVDLSWPAHATAVGADVAPRLPDLGPATVMDQLTVSVYDLVVAGPQSDQANLVTDLADLRRRIG